MPGLQMKSRSNRIPVSLEADVFVRGQVLKVEVTDLTGEGCCVTGTYRIGEWLSIALPRTNELRAQVRWAVFGKSGLRFENGLGR
jgi:hypothetical protein